MEKNGFFDKKKIVNHIFFSTSPVAALGIWGKEIITLSLHPF